MTGNANRLNPCSKPMIRMMPATRDTSLFTCAPFTTVSQSLGSSKVMVNKMYEANNR